MADHNILGKWGEDFAADYLERQGYVVLDRNWRYGRSKVDLDLVCRTEDGREVVFVEVKTRENDEGLTAPEDAVDTAKIRGLGRAAHHYVEMNQVVEDLRFDIIAIIGSPTASQDATINHISDAFNPLLV